MRVHRKGTDATQPLDPGVVVDGVSPWTGVSALKFDGKSSVKLPSLELSGAESFSMMTWLHLPKIELHPGQTGGSLALVIAGQVTTGDSERHRQWRRRDGFSRSMKECRGSGWLTLTGK